MFPGYLAALAYDIVSVTDTVLGLHQLCTRVLCMWLEEW